MKKIFYALFVFLILTIFTIIVVNAQAATQPNTTVTPSNTNDNAISNTSNTTKLETSTEDSLKKMFDITVKVDKPIVIGQNKTNGRRQLIPILSGTLTGQDFSGKAMEGVVLQGGVDSQIIKPNGVCELSARYGVTLSDGSSFYIENNGIRTVPDEYITKVLTGEFIDPDLYYFCTNPKFEVYSEKLDWLTKYLFVCKAKRLPDQVILSFFIVQK